MNPARSISGTRLALFALVAAISTPQSSEGQSIYPTPPPRAKLTSRNCIEQDENAIYRGYGLAGGAAWRAPQIATASIGVHRDIGYTDVSKGVFFLLDAGVAGSGVSIGGYTGSLFCATKLNVMGLGASLRASAFRTYGRPTYRGVQPAQTFAGVEARYHLLFNFGAGLFRRVAGPRKPDGLAAFSLGMGF